MEAGIPRVKVNCVPVSYTHLDVYKRQLWSYMGFLFSDSEKCRKKIWKSQNLPEYEAAVKRLFEDHELIEGAGYRPMC